MTRMQVIERKRKVRLDRGPVGMSRPMVADDGYAVSSGSVALDGALSHDQGSADGMDRAPLSRTPPGGGRNHDCDRENWLGVQQK